MSADPPQARGTTLLESGTVGVGGPLELEPEDAGKSLTISVSLKGARLVEPEPEPEPESEAAPPLELELEVELEGDATHTVERADLDETAPIIIGAAATVGAVAVGLVGAVGAGAAVGGRVEMDDTAAKSSLYVEPNSCTRTTSRHNTTQQQQ